MRVVDLSPDFAKTIAGWRYPGAFDVYDGSQRAPLVPGTDFAVIDDHDHLVGHCAITGGLPAMRSSSDAVSNFSVSPCRAATSER